MFIENFDSPLSLKEQRNQQKYFVTLSFCYKFIFSNAYFTNVLYIYIYHRDAAPSDSLMVSTLMF